MSIANIMPAVRELSRLEKFELTKFLLDDLAREESSPMFKEGHVYPIYTPQFGPDVASQLAKVLVDEGHRP